MIERGNSGIGELPAGQFLHLLTFCLSAGLLIYGCYGVWHSTLELEAREQQAHASSYQRYDDHLDDTFSPGDSFYPQEQDEGPYQGWSSPKEKGFDYLKENRHDDQDQSQYEENHDQYGYQSTLGGQYAGWGSRSAGRTNHGFDVSDEED